MPPVQFPRTLSPTRAMLVALLVIGCGSPGGDGGSGAAGSGGAGAGGRGGGAAAAGTGGSEQVGSGGQGGTSSQGGAPASSGGASGGAGGAGGADVMPPATGGQSGSSVDSGGDTSAGNGNDGASSNPARILIYTRRTTATHNQSIPVAIATLTAMAKAASLAVEASEDASAISTANLARFGAVVMVNSNGLPFGSPGTEQGNALAAFVKAGGGLAAFHAAANTEYEADHPLLALLGGVFNGTGGGVRRVSCASVSQHATVAKIMNPLTSAMDETYSFATMNAMNEVVLRCDPAMGTGKVVGSWVRQEGAGRVFYTTLGHGPGAWEMNGAFVTTHAWPGVLWALGK
jgi:uncharacterized protein